MAQVSSNTLTYDQIYIKIRDFYLKEVRGDFQSNQQRLEDYKKLLTDINESLLGPMTKYDPYIKGEPPMSSKFNAYARSVAEDLSLISKQTDYLNAKAINAFNLFSSEIEAEKKYIERISSKAKILQMYSKAPAEDLIYLGDSFDNSDFVDITKIPIGLIPSIQNGALTLPINRSRPWVAKKVSIDNLSSNGFIGNNHQVIKDLNPNNSSEYDYVYQSSRTISSLTSIVDSSPATYFEYEALSVDKSTSSPPAPLNLIGPNEFSYIVDKRTIDNVVEGTLVDWSNFDMSQPLQLKIVLDNPSAPLANNIKIVPYFGSNQLVKVTSVLATKQNGDTVEVLNKPIYIGSSFVPLNLEISNNYFYNEAIVKFAEIRASKFEITFEQEVPNDVLIKHMFFKPSFRPNTGQNNPFYGLARFNPLALNNDEYEDIEYDQYKYVPSILQPNRFKDFDIYSDVIPVRMIKRPSTYNEYGIVILATKQFTEYDFTFYYYNGLKNQDGTVIESFNLVNSLADLYMPDSESYDLLGNRTTFNSIEDGQNEYDKLVFYLDNNYYDEETDKYIVQLGDSTYLIEKNDIFIQQLNYTSVTQPKTYNVPVSTDFELYNAKRKAIGIRDISITYETYGERAQMVSKPFLYESPIESIMLSVESSYDNTFRDKFEIEYYLSINDSSWIRVSPIQLSSNGIAEVLVFNKNIPINYQIPGVAYLNYPQVPVEVNKVVVRMDIAKQRFTNMTPSIFSYQLMAKVKQQ